MASDGVPMTHPHPTYGGRHAGTHVIRVLANDGALERVGQMAATTEHDVEFFTLKTPYLKQGITTDYVAKTDMMSVAMKVYAEGGENRMHLHPAEDHSFIVMEGEATFHVGTPENIHVLRRFEGVMLPMGTPYYFQSSGSGNLVMIRVGATEPGMPEIPVYPDGQTKAQELEPEKNRLERIELPGPGFGDEEPVSARAGS